MFSFHLFVLVLAITSTSRALPQSEGSLASTPIISQGSDAAVTSTVAISGQPSDAANKPGDLGEPIEGTSFFSIGRECFSDKRDVDGTQFPNRAAFYTQAYKDAVAIADKATAWPQYGIDASDLYFGTATEDSDYADNIKSMS